MFSLRGLTIYYAKSGRRTSAVRGFSWRSRRRDWLFEGKCGSVQQSITVWQPERKRTGGVLRLRLALMRQAVGIVRRTSSDGVCRTMSNPEQPVDFLVPVLEPNGAEYSDRHSMRIQREHAQVILVFDSRTCQPSFQLSRISEKRLANPDLAPATWCQSRHRGRERPARRGAAEAPSLHPGRAPCPMRSQSEPNEGRA